MTVPLYKARKESQTALDEVLETHGSLHRHFEPRDLDIMETLYLRRFLTTTQVAREFFDGGGDSARNRTCQIRLKKLYDRGFVDRFRPPGENGSNPYIWTIDRLGFELLQHLRGDHVAKWDLRQKVPEMSKVILEVELNEFRLSLMLEARNRNLNPIWLLSRECVQVIKQET